MPKLVVSLPSGTEQTFELTDEMITVGRMPDNMIEIADVSVSSHHAELTVTQGDYSLKDLGSTNGTRVNGHNVTESHLQNGDRVRFGKVEAIYQSDTPAGARELPQAEVIDIRPAQSSVKPTDFENASPFTTKGKKKDPAGKVVIAFAAISVLAFVGALISILMLSPD